MKKRASIFLTMTALMFLLPLATYSETSSPPQAVGTAECGSGGRGGQTHTRPIQAAKLESRLSFCSSSPALYLKGERREECAAVDDTPVTDARSAKEEEMEETANYRSGRSVNFRFKARIDSLTTSVWVLPDCWQ
jgi:hypothetical protein